MMPIGWWPIPALITGQTMVALGTLMAQASADGPVGSAGGLVGLAGQAGQLGGLTLAIIAVIWLAKRLSEERAQVLAERANFEERIKEKDLLLLEKLGEKDALLERKDSILLETFKQATQAMEAHQGTVKRMAQTQDKMLTTLDAMNLTQVAFQRSLEQCTSVRNVLGGNKGD